MESSSKSITIQYKIDEISVHLLISYTKGESFVAPHIKAIHQRDHLCEQSQYDFRIIYKSPNTSYRFQLEENRYITNRIDEKRMGTIRTAGYCGFLECKLKIIDGDSIRYKTEFIEVESVKFRYEVEYRSMLKYLSERYNQLLIDASAPVSNQFYSILDADTITEQQYEFLRNVIDNELLECLAQITNNPHEQLTDDEQSIPINRIAKFSRQMQQQLVNTSNRVMLPPHLQLNNLTSVPRNITRINRINTIDTPENRFVKKIIIDFQRLVLQICQKVERNSGHDNEQQFMSRDAQRLLHQLNTLLKNSFFQEITQSSNILVHSSVMQRRRGYRDLLRLWLRFVNGSRFEWVNGQEAEQMLFKAGARDAATLYEYWLFFHLSQLFCSIFHVNETLSDKIIKISETAYQQVTLQKGSTVSIEGIYSQSPRSIKAKFWYNKVFSVTNRHAYNEQGSWTQAFTPDYTISLWPASFTEIEAEANETMVHIHFDAKYRATINSILGADNEVIHNSAEAKASDLIKMHAYRDAIRRTVGAFVLYPSSIENTQEDNNSQPKILRRHKDEILPSIGAIAVSCADNGDALGMNHVKNFILDVLSHLSTRSTLREHISYQTYQILRTPAMRNTTPYASTYAEFKQGDTSERTAPASLITILQKTTQNEFEIACAQSSQGLVFIQLPEHGKIEESLIQVEYIAVNDIVDNKTHYCIRLNNHVEILTHTQLHEAIQQLIPTIEFPTAQQFISSIYLVYRTAPTTDIKLDHNNSYNNAYTSDYDTISLRKISDPSNTSTIDSYNLAKLHDLIQ